jgi:hypothetical protein
MKKPLDFQPVPGAQWLPGSERQGIPAEVMRLAERIEITATDAQGNVIFIRKTVRALSGIKAKK